MIENIIYRRQTDQYGMVFKVLFLKLIWGIISTLLSPKRGKKPVGIFCFAFLSGI